MRIHFMEPRSIQRCIRLKLPWPMVAALDLAPPPPLSSELPAHPLPAHIRPRLWPQVSFAQVGAGVGPEIAAPEQMPPEVDAIEPDASEPDAIESDAIEINTSGLPKPDERRFVPTALVNQAVQAPIIQTPIIQTPIIQTAPTDPVPGLPATNQTLVLSDIQVVGSSIFQPQDLATIIAAFQNRLLQPNDLRELSDRITQLYLSRGYITSRALDPVILGDRATVQVIEGSIEAIEISGTQRLNPDYIRRRILLGAGQPLNTQRLEAQLKLLRGDPLFKSFEASLKAGSGLGQSILVVTVQEAKPVTAQVSADNALPPSVGGEQFGLQVQHQNLTGNGDRLGGSYGRSRTGGSQQYNVFYTTPVAIASQTLPPGTVSASAQVTRTRITQDDFEAFGIRGTSERYALTYRQPLIRTPQQELALSAGFTYQDGQTFLFEDRPTPFGLGPDADGVSRTSVFHFAQDYVKRDASGAWVLQSQVNFGTGLLGATENSDPVPDGQFVSWLGQAQRIQRLGKRHLLLAQGSLQLTPDALLPSQQFSLGGGQSLRGYRQNARSGDNGFRFSLEDRITVLRNAAGDSTLQLAPFAEVGQVWNAGDNPNRLSDQRLLASLGLGIIWQPRPQVTLRLDYGLPLVGLRDRGENLQDKGLHFSTSYRF